MPAPDSKTPYDFIYDFVTIRSDRGGSLDISEAVGQIDLYEHLEKSFMTGTIILSDTTDLFNVIQFRGTEYVDIQISFPSDQRLPLRKTFIVTKVDQNKKGLNDNTAAIIIQLVEEHFFLSKITNLSKAYEGKPNEIIQTVLTDSRIGRSLFQETPEAQTPVRYLSPYVTPLKIARYMTNLSTTEEGLPYFLYSSLSAESEEIVFRHLGEILESPIDRDPFIYSQALTGLMNGSLPGSSGVDLYDPRLSGSELSRGRTIELEKKGRVIEDYRHWNSYDLLRQAELGNIGTDYELVNANQFNTRGFHLDYTDTLSQLNPYLPRDQVNPTYDSTSFGGIHNRRVAQAQIMYLSNIYSDSFYNPYDNELYTSPGRLANAKALRESLSLDMIDVKVPGFNFFPFAGDSGRRKGRCVGRSVNLKFLNNNIEADLTDPDNSIDKKISGQYMVYSAKHTFGMTKYTVSMTCAKYSDLFPNQGLTS